MALPKTLIQVEMFQNANEIHHIMVLNKILQLYENGFFTLNVTWSTNRKMILPQLAKKYYSLFQISIKLGENQTSYYNNIQSADLEALNALIDKLPDDF